MRRSLGGLLLLALLASTPLDAATRRFTGLGDRSSWTDPANWEGNTIPGPDDHAILSNGAGNLPIQVSGAEVSVGSVEVQQRLEVRNATLTVTRGIEVVAQTVVLDNAIVLGGITNRPGTFMGIRFEGDSSLVTEPIDGAAIELDGNVPPGTTLILRGAATGSLFWQSGKANFGTLRLAPNAGQPAEIHGGTTPEVPLVNEASGVIEVIPGFGESRLAAHLINRGTGSVANDAIGSVRWLFRSSIQGQFIRYRAMLEHLGPLSGRPELASIREATIHELIHLVEADGDLADGQPDFLVNDDPDDSCPAGSRSWARSRSSMPPST